MSCKNQKTDQIAKSGPFLYLCDMRIFYILIILAVLAGCKARIEAFDSVPYVVDREKVDSLDTWKYRIHIEDEENVYILEYFNRQFFMIGDSLEFRKKMYRERSVP